MKFGDQYAGEYMIRAAGKRFIRGWVVREKNPMRVSDAFNWYGRGRSPHRGKPLRWRVRDCAAKS